MQYMPMATALGFVAAINTANSASLRSRMTSDHVFTDAVGRVYYGADSIIAGWEQFFRSYPRYLITVDQWFVQEDMVALFGRASGCWRVGESVLTQRWTVPAAWLAQVSHGRIAAWSVFCDTGWGKPPSALLNLDTAEAVPCYT